MRLIIDRLVLENFKSYAGKKVLGPFHPKFTCVVGPNGAGKSNVIDAMLFVFGRRAQQMRHKKIGDLIHRSKGTRCSFARVEIVFCEVEDDADGFRRLDGSEFVVAREVNLDSNSRYFLNGEPAHMREITELLKSKGVDLDHNRFLILQGEVEQISLMPAKSADKNKEGLLEFLEDIIGSNRLVPEIEKSEEELEAGLAVLSEQKERLKVVKGELDALEGPVREARRFCDLERKLKVAEALVERKLLNEANKEFLKVKAELEEFQKEYDEWTASLDEDRRRRAELEGRVAESEAQLRKVTRHKQKADAACEACEGEDHQAEIALANANKKVKSLETEIRKLKKEKRETADKIAEKEEFSRTYQIKLPRKEAELAEAEAELEKLERTVQTELDALVAKKEIVEKRSEPKRAQVSDLKAKKKIADSKRSLLEDKKNAQGVDGVATKMNEAKEKLKMAKSQAKEAEAGLKSKRKALGIESNRLEALEKEQAKLERRAEELRKLYNDNDEAFAASKKNSRSPAAAIMKAAEAGELSVVGSLWDLVRFEAKYEAAFAASGSNVEYIVTQTTKEAEKVIAFARKQNMPRVQCVVLDKVAVEMKPHMEKLRKRSGYPDDCTFLIDLVEMDDARLDSAIYFVVKDTMVTSTLDEARKLSFGATRYRVVTLDGQSVEKSGVMSGGLNHTRKRPVRSEVTLQQVEASRKEHELAMASLRHHREERRQASLSISNLQNEVKQLESSLESLCGKVATQEDVLSTLARMGQEKRVEMTAKELDQLKRLSDQCLELDEQISRLEEDLEEARGEVDRVNDDIDAVGGPRRADLRAKVQNLSAEVTTMRETLDDAPMDVELLKSKVTEVEKKKIPEKESALESVKKQIKNIETSRERATQQAAEAKAKRKEMEHLSSSIVAELDSLRHQLAEVDDLNKEASKKEVEFQNRKSDLDVAMEKRRGINKKHLHVLSKLKAAYVAVPCLECADVDFEDASKETQKESQKSEAASGPVAIEDKKESPTKLELQAKKEPLESALSMDGVLELTSEQLDELELLPLEMASEKLHMNLENLPKPDIRVVEKFMAVKDKFDKRRENFESVRADCDALRVTLDGLKSTREAEFRSGFERIALCLKELYQMLTVGGDAELELAQPDAPFEGGVLFSVRPPRKSWRPIRHLSGGEKTLSSLALIFALHRFKPSVLYFLDEIDAALDYRNVAIIAHSVAARTENAQFIIISLRSQMFEVADRLVGIYKIQDMTKSITLDPEEYAETCEA